MPMNAKFTADFSGFLDACQKADIALKQIDSGAATAQQRLTNMTNSLSGRVVIQQALLMAQAVEELGGVSTLTATELARVGGVAEEAAAKLTALGKAVPDSIGKLTTAYHELKKAQDDAAKSAEPGGGGLLGSLGGMTKKATELAGALGLAFGAKEIIGGVKDLIVNTLDAADAIEVESKKLGISAQAYQGWVAAAKLAGGTSENVSTAIAFMNKTLDGGENSTVQALRTAGLEFNTIRQLGPEEAFKAIAAAIKQIPDPMTQARVAVQLLGRDAQTLLPAIKDDIIAVGDAAAKMSDETVASLAHAKNAWTEFGQKVTIVTGEMLAAIMGTDALSVAMKQLTAEQRASILAQLPAQATTEDYAKALIDAAHRHHDVALAAEQAAKSQATFVQSLTAAKEAYAALKPAEIAEIQAGLDIGKSATDIETKMGLAAGTVELFKTHLQEAKEAQRLAAAEAKKHGEALDALAAVQQQLDPMMAAYVVHLHEQGLSTEHISEVTKINNDLISATITAHDKAAEAAKKHYDAELKHTADLQASLQSLFDHNLKQGEAAASSLSKAVISNYDEIAKSTTKLGELQIEEAGIVADAQIAAAKRAGIGIEQLLQLQIDASNRAYRLEVQKIVDAGKARQDALKTWAPGYQAAFDDIQREVDQALTNIALKHGIVLDQMAHDARAKIPLGWAQGLSLVGSSFAQLAQISGGAFPEIARSVGSVTSSLGSMLTAWNAASKAGFSAAGIAALASTWVGVAVAVYQAAVAIYDWHKKQKEMDARLNESRIIALDYGRALNEVFSEGLTQNIQTTSNTIHAQFENMHGAIITLHDGLMLSLHGSILDQLARQWAEAVRIADVIKEMGGLTAGNLPVVEKAMHDLINVIALGGPEAADAMDALKTQITTLGDYFEKNGGVWDDTFKKLIADSQTLGGDVAAAATAALAQQTDKATQGLTTFLTAGATAYDTIAAKQTELADLQAQYADASADQAPKIKAQIDDVTKAIDDQRKILQATGVTSQQSAEAFGTALFGSFGMALKQGKSLTDAIAAIAPGVQALQTQLDATGLSGGEAFGKLSELVKLTSDAVAGPALQAVSGLDGALQGLANTGLLDQETFAGLADQVGQTYAALIEQGADGNTALAAMQPTLQTIWELEKQYGFTVDESTQKLVDQAEQQGIVGEEHESIAEQMLKATKEISAAVTGLAHVFGVILPADMDKAAKAGTDAAKQITTELGKVPKNLTVDVGYNVAQPPSGPAPTEAEPHATGGIVGGASISAPVLFRPHGTDTIPAMLTRGEEVLTPEQSKAYHAGAGGGDTLNVHVEVTALDTADMQAAVERKVIPAIVAAVRVNRRQSRTDLRSVLGVSTDALGAS